MSSKIKDGEHVINFKKYKLIRTHWIAINGDNVIWFDSFGVEYIPPKKLKDS